MLITTVRLSGCSGEVVLKSLAAWRACSAGTIAPVSAAGWAGRPRPRRARLAGWSGPGAAGRTRRGARCGRTSGSVRGKSGRSLRACSRRHHRGISRGSQTHTHGRARRDGGARRGTPPRDIARARAGGAGGGGGGSRSRAAAASSRARLRVSSPSRQLIAGGDRCIRQQQHQQHHHQDRTLAAPGTLTYAGEDNARAACVRAGGAAPRDHGPRVAARAPSDSKSPGGRRSDRAAEEAVRCRARQRCRRGSSTRRLRGAGCDGPRRPPRGCTRRSPGGIRQGVAALQQRRNRMEQVERRATRRAPDRREAGVRPRPHQGAEGAGGGGARTPTRSRSARRQQQRGGQHNELLEHQTIVRNATRCSTTWPTRTSGSGTGL